MFGEIDALLITRLDINLHDSVAIKDVAKPVRPCVIHHISGIGCPDIVVCKNTAIVVLGDNPNLSGHPLPLAEFRQLKPFTVLTLVGKLVHGFPHICNLLGRRIPVQGFTAEVSEVCKVANGCRLVHRCNI